jgi:hypothetical protein
MVLVPFDAITQFGDPSVGFALKFEMQEPELEGGANDTDVPASTQRSAGEASLFAKRPQDDTSRQDEKSSRSAAPDSKTESLFRHTEETGLAPSHGDEAISSEAAPNVVSIDAFRKKT